MKDSKQLMPKRRIELFGELQKASIYSIAIATVNDINERGIYRARNWAIISAGRSLVFRLLIMDICANPDKVIIDGYFSKKWLTIFKIEFGNIHTECLINGDEKVYEISAASIMAKVYMDALFQGFGSFYPEYGFEHDHGSPSLKHIEGIRKMGPSPYHRTGNYAKEWWKRIIKKEDK